MAGHFLLYQFIQENDETEDRSSILIEQEPPCPLLQEPAPKELYLKLPWLCFSQHSQMEGREQSSQFLEIGVSFRKLVKVLTEEIQGQGQAGTNQMY